MRRAALILVVLLLAGCATGGGRGEFAGPYVGGSLGNVQAGSHP